MDMIHRLAIIGAAALAPLAVVTVVSPGVSNAIECGWGTVFDPPSNTCVAAPLRHRHRHLRRQRGTVISRRASGLAFACPFPFHSHRRCAPVSEPGRSCSGQLAIQSCAGVNVRSSSHRSGRPGRADLRDTASNSVDAASCAAPTVICWPSPSSRGRSTRQLPAKMSALEDVADTLVSPIEMAHANPSVVPKVVQLAPPVSKDADRTTDLTETVQPPRFRSRHFLQRPPRGT